MTITAQNQLIIAGQPYTLRPLTFADLEIVLPRAQEAIGRSLPLLEALAEAEDVLWRALRRDTPDIDRALIRQELDPTNYATMVARVFQISGLVPADEAAPAGE